MGTDKIVEILDKAIDTLYEIDGHLLLKAYNVHERTVTSLIARYIWAELEDDSVSVDVEYNRMRSDYSDDSEDDIQAYISKRLNLAEYERGWTNVMPDIIIHERNSDKNYAIIEVKMGWKNEAKQFDYIKINEYMNQLGYNVGLYIELHEERSDVVIEHGPFKI